MCKVRLGLLFLAFVTMFWAPVSQNSSLYAKETQEEILKKEAEELTYSGQLNKANELIGKELDKFGKNKSNSGEAETGWDMTSLALGILWGSIGAGYFIYGKKQSKALFLLCGIGLCVFPMFVSGIVLNLVLGLGMCIIPFKIQI